jgi:hypothetical protein
VNEIKEPSPVVVILHFGHVKACVPDHLHSVFLLRCNQAYDWSSDQCYTLSGAFVSRHYEASTT